MKLKKWGFFPKTHFPFRLFFIPSKDRSLLSFLAGLFLFLDYKFSYTIRFRVV